MENQEQNEIKKIEIELNEKNQNRIKSLINERNQIMQVFNELLVVILDSNDIDYTNMKVDLSEDFKKIILTENGKS